MLNAAADHFDHNLDENLIDNSVIETDDKDDFIVSSESINTVSPSQISRALKMLIVQSMHALFPPSLSKLTWNIPDRECQKHARSIEKKTLERIKNAKPSFLER